MLRADQAAMRGLSFFQWADKQQLQNQSDKVEAKFGKLRSASLSPIFRANIARKKFLILYINTLHKTYPTKPFKFIRKVNVLTHFVAEITEAAQLFSESAAGTVPFSPKDRLSHNHLNKATWVTGSGAHCSCVWLRVSSPSVRPAQLCPQSPVWLSPEVKKPGKRQEALFTGGPSLTVTEVNVSSSFL